MNQQLHNICDRIKMLRVYGVETLADVSILAALAQAGGALTMAQLVEQSKLGQLTVSARLMNMAWASPHLSLHWPRVFISGVPMPNTLPLDIPDAANISLSASGWLATHYMGYGRPAVFLPDTNTMAPVLADGRDPEEQAKELFSQTHRHWSYEPHVPFHKAP